MEKNIDVIYIGNVFKKQTNLILITSHYYKNNNATLFVLVSIYTSYCHLFTAFTLIALKKNHSIAVF